MKMFKALSALLCAVMAAQGSEAAFDRSKLPSLKIQGVNMGGWLVLEYFITPKIWDDVDPAMKPKDEFRLVSALGPKAEEVLLNHYKTFITEEDFANCPKLGVNAVRVPVAHWAIMEDPPYVYQASLPYLDKAFQWAKKYGLWVVLDLHTAPGAQNPWDHSGRAEFHQWGKDPKYPQQTLDVIDQLMNRYGKKENLYAVGVLNEPHENPEAVQMAFYDSAYTIVRKYCTDCFVLYFDGFNTRYDPLISKWAKANKKTNVMIDSHKYTTFGGLKDFEQVKEGAKIFVTDITNVTEYEGLPISIGEFALAHTDANSPYQDMHTAYPGSQYTEYWNIQKAAFAKASGIYFWNYKLSPEATQLRPEWSFVESVKRKWMQYNAVPEGSSKAGSSADGSKASEDDSSSSSGSSPTKKAGAVSSASTVFSAGNVAIAIVSSALVVLSSSL